MLKTLEQKQEYIKSLTSTATPHEIRRIIRKTFGVKKTRGNEIFRELFDGRDIGATVDFGNLNEEIEKLAQKIEKTGEVVHTSNLSTLDEVLKEIKADLTKWQVSHYAVESKRDAKTGENRFTFKISFKKNTEAIAGEVLKDILEDIKKNSPIVKVIHGKSVENNDLMLEIIGADWHVGRLCWGPSDGDDYDLKIAEKLIFEAVNDVVTKAKRFGNYSKICFWLGGDYLNVDNENNTTTALTQQAVDSRFPKVFKKGKEILVAIIDSLKEIAPVDVVVSLGNHDRNSLYHMGELLEAYYRADKNVHIDNSPTPRKYYRYGQNVIQFSHGDKVPIKKLPSIAAVECKEWSSCGSREIHTGHLHHTEVTETAGCITRIMSTIAGVDGYHSENGYIGNVRRIQSFIWHRDLGLQAEILSNAVKS